MSRYIDADKLHYSRIRIMHEDGTIGGYNAVVMSAEINNAPTADVEEVKHGEWIDTGSGQKCSVCGEIQYGYDSYRHRCSYCGAKMDKEKEEI